MERHRLAVLTALAVFAVPAAAQAAPVKIGPKPTSATASSAVIEVANPNRQAVRGTATVAANGRTAAKRTVTLRKKAVAAVTLRFDAAGREALQAAGGRATVKLVLRGGGKRYVAKRTMTLQLATPGGGSPAPTGGNANPTGGGANPTGGGSKPGGGTGPQPTPTNNWAGRMGDEGAYDDFKFTLVNGQITITEPPLVPVYCFENGAGHYGSALSFEPFLVAGPWTLGSDGSVQQSGIAVNRLVSGGSRGITYKATETAQAPGKVTGKLGMSFMDSKYDIFTNQIWFVNCSGTQSFEAVPAA